MLEMDAAGCFDLVAAHSAVALAQGMVREIPGAVVMPLAASPLRWRHLLGWDRGGPAARAAPEVFELVVQAYREIVGQRRRSAGAYGVRGA